MRCNGAPYIPWCDVARDWVCNIFKDMDPSNTTNIVVIIGEEGSSGSGLDAQCCASARHNGGGTEKVSMEVCQNKFMALEGCQNSNNTNYNPWCVGGNTNVHYNDNDIGTEIDRRNPWYALGVPEGMAGAGAAVYKPGDSNQETTTSRSGGATSHTTSRTSAGGARSGGGGVSAGVGYVGAFTGK